MKKVKKLRNKLTQEIYYTFPEWPSKDIDGVVFLAVVRNQPSQSQTQQIYYVKKDSLETVK